MLSSSENSVVHIETIICNDLLNLILTNLSCHPHLFNIMQTNKFWNYLSHNNYKQRHKYIEAKPDLLLHALDTASPGDTIILMNGIHMLSKELTINIPIKIQSIDKTIPSVICSNNHIVVRTCNTCYINSVTICRLGNNIGYPNAAIFAEVGKLYITNCRITCQNSISTIDEIINKFNLLPPPGKPFDLSHSNLYKYNKHNSIDDRPQCGIWIGIAAYVFIQDSFIISTMGPGIKLYRGEAFVKNSTIAFSHKGANIIANGGKISLESNEILAAFGDGISIWNKTDLYLKNNSIHSNTNSGIANNSIGGKFLVTNNKIFNNTKCGIFFTTSKFDNQILNSNLIINNTTKYIVGFRKI